MNMVTPTLAEVFLQRIFLIPDYQRGYAWDTPHRKALLDDIEHLPDGKNHFAGLIVLHRLPDPPVMDDGGQHLMRYNVVDGQQRLTSLVLLLNAVARQFETAGREPLAKGIRTSYVATKGLGGDPLWRFVSGGVSSDAWWQGVIQDAKTPIPAADPAQRRLQAAREEFDDFLEEKREALPSKDDWLRWLETTYRKITGHLRFAVYEVADEADMGVIFEVMNDRGKPLTVMEKVKNYLLYLATKLHVDTVPFKKLVNGTWATIFRRLEESDLSDHEDDVLRVHWMVTRDPKEWKGYPSVKSRFGLKEWEGRHAELLSALEQYVKTLDQACFSYVEATKPTEGNTFSEWGTQTAAVRHWSAKLVRLGRLANLRPLLVAARMEHPKDAEGYLTLVKACERYAFRVHAVMEKGRDS